MRISKKIQDEIREFILSSYENNRTELQYLLIETVCSRKKIDYIQASLPEEVDMVTVYEIFTQKEESSENMKERILKAVLAMFRCYKEEWNLTYPEQFQTEKQKQLLAAFERTVKSIRLTGKEWHHTFQEYPSDVEFLFELSEIYDIAGCFEKLVAQYLEQMNKKYIVIVFNSLEEK